MILQILLVIGLIILTIFSCQISFVQNAIVKMILGLNLMVALIFFMFSMLSYVYLIPFIIYEKTIGRLF